MKKIITLGVCCVVVIFGLYFSTIQKGKNIEETTMENEKVLYSEGLMGTYAGGSMNNGYNLSDVIIKGNIIDIYQKENDLFMATEKMEGNVPTITCTYYTIEVEDCYVGEVEDTIITYREVGDFDTYCTKPTDKSEVILFLNRRAEDNHTVYVSTMREHSIITIDDNNKLYSYSNTQELSSLDGKDVKSFETCLSETMKENNYIQSKTISFK